MRLFRRRRIDADQVVADGSTRTGTMVGIRVWETSGDENSGGTRIDEYAIDVNGETVGVRQRLVPDDRVRLGMVVVVRYLDGKAVIDWPATCGGTSGFTAAILDTPPAPGIEDETLGLRKAQKKGVPGVATIEGATLRSTMLGLAQVLQLELVVRPDGTAEYELVADKVVVPHYATHLVREGATLPCWVRLGRLDRVAIDWPAAATQEPGVGLPPAEILSGVGNVFTGMSPPGVQGQNAVTGAATFGANISPPTADGFGTEGGVTFDQWVAVEAGLTRDRVAPADADAYAQRHGVPAGVWADAVVAWQRRMRSDWRVGAAFGEAIERVR